jgi:chromosome segregation ATPase
MPFPLIPVIIAGASALISGIGAGVGVGVHKNNKYNKAQKEWQDQKAELQKQLLVYQSELTRREERILELQQKLTERTKQLEEATRKLYETDNMIELLMQRHKELESFVRKFVAIILFRYGKHKAELNEVVGRITKNEDEKVQMLDFISRTKENSLAIEAEIQKETKEKQFSEDEIKKINEKILEMES